jgi:hypothetical protein
LQKTILLDNIGKIHYSSRWLWWHKTRCGSEIIAGYVNNPNVAGATVLSLVARIYK